MRKLSKMKEKVLSIVLSCVMIVSLFAGSESLEVNAADSVHTHDGITFQAINSSNYSKLSTAGNYYLEEDIKITSRIDITSGTVNLCLNGKKLYANGLNSSLFYVENATLKIYDCVGTGILTGGKGYPFNNGNKKGGAIYLRHSTLYMYGGTITGNQAAWGGAVFIDGSNNTSTFNMYGGTIDSNTADSGGGGIEVENANSVLNLYGGSIVNNTVTNTNGNLHKGGGVHFAAGNVNIFGTHGDVIIKDNKVDGVENNLYLRSDKTITIPSDATISNNSSIGVSAAKIEEGNSVTTVTVTSSYGANKPRIFFLDGIHTSQCYIVYNSSNVSIVKKDSHNHSLTQVSENAATCTENGNNAYYQCGCGKYYKDINGTTETTVEAETIPAGHSWSTEWTKDESNHWKSCGGCEEINEEAAHVDADSDNACDVCGYVMVTEKPSETIGVKYEFSYAYDCQRSPTYPKKGDEVEMRSFNTPLGATQSYGNWEVIDCGKYDRNIHTEYIKTSIATIVTNMANKYGIMDSEVNVFELKKDGEHICYGVVATVFEDGLFFIGTTWSNSGAGYYLCNQELSSSAGITKNAIGDTSDLPSIEPSHTHVMTEVPAKAATCKEEGNTVYYTCSGCESLFADENATTTTTAEAVKVAILEHDWTGEWIVVKEATATEEGKKETLCTRGCGEKKEETIPVIEAEPVDAPVIVTHPEDKTVEEGETATFAVTATGENLTYRWQIDRNDGNGFVNLNGATSASYTTSAVDMDCDGFKYQCIVTNEGGSVTSNAATLTVTEAPVVHAHALTQVPAKEPTCKEEGNTVYYTCSGCDSMFADENATTTTTAEAVKVAVLEHDWTGEWIVVKEATATEEGKKETLCTRGCGEKKEETIPVIEAEPVDAPVIVTHPENKTVEDGNTTTFSVTATGENLTYQWKIDRNDGNGFVNLNGATSASYTTSTVDMDCDGFKYQCIVSNEGGSVTSDIATLTVTEKPSVHTHSLTQVPAKAATCTEEGNMVYYTCSGCDNLFADANGTTTTTAEAVKIAALEHDWTGEWTVVKEATATEEGKKETLCTRGCGEKKEEVIPATGVEAVDAPVITIQPENKTAEDGNTTTFSVTATGENLTYQWKIDRNDGNGFVNLNGATSASYTTSTVDMDCNGFKYQCIVSNEGGSVTSDIATLTVTEKPSVHTHSLTQVPAKAATCTEEGNKAYYTCSGCDSLFTDANGTTTTTAEAIKVAALEHDWTGEWTVIKEATATEEGKKETLCTNGCGQKKVVVIPATGTTDDNGNLEKDAEVEPEAPIDEVTLNNSKEELLDAGNIFTDAEKTQIEDGADARIWLEIGKTDEGAIASTDKAKIEEEASRIMGENPEITYFDADLFKQVGNGAKQEISEPGIPMKITITIPGKLINRDKNILREFKIIRLHDGKVEIISGTFNAATGEFTFESDKFSTYAIIYKDVPVADNTNTTPGNNGNNNPTQGSNGGQTSGDANVSKPMNDKKDEVPKTGNNTGTGYAFMLMLLSGLGIVISSRKKKIWNKEA